MLQQPDGVIWVATAGGLARIDPAAHAFPPVPLAGRGTAPVRRLLRGRDGLLWVAAGQHLFSLDPRDGGTSARAALRSSDRTATRSEWDVESLAEDAEGNLWVGTTWGLIVRDLSGGFSPIQVRPSLSDD